MKTNRLLRVLSLIGFLLLMAPFYDSCDGGGFRKVRETELNGKLVETPLYLKVYDVFVDEESFNAFQIASLSIYTLKEATFTDFKNDIAKSVKLKDWYKDMGVLVSFIFIVVILLSFSLLILSFTERRLLFKKVALVNLVLIVLTVCYILFLEKSFEHFSQIKWGYYAFILNSAFIYYYAAKAKHLTH
jgi:hypothetical protein